MRSSWLLGAGILLRILIASARIDRFWPDEHYQTLEPAYHLLHGGGVLAWEWQQGFRSWSLPALHVPMLALSWALGFKGGLGATLIARICYGLLDAWVWLRLSEWLAPKRESLQKALFLATALLSPTLALWGVTTLQDHLALLLFWGLIPWVLEWTLPDLRSNPRPEPRRFAQAGFLLFAIAIPKPQLALLSLGTALGILWIVRRDLRYQEGKSALGAAVSGAIGAALLAGLIDWTTTGEFAGTILKQASQGEQISRFYGTSPWWHYFMKLPDLLGGAALVGMVLMFIGGFAGPLDPRAKTLFLATGPGILLFLGFHSLIPHKELRFLMPLIPGLLLMPWVLGGSLRKFWQPSLPVFPRQGEPLLLILLVPALYASAQESLTRDLPYSSVEVGRLEEAIRLDLKTSPLASKLTLCVLGGDWSFMRGSLALESPVDYVSAYSQKELISRRELMSGCHYAILKKGWQIPGGGAWMKLPPEQNGFQLFKREAFPAGDPKS